MRALAADIGGTSLRAALVDDAGAILDRRTAPTPTDADAGCAVLRAFWDELGPADGAALAVAGGIRASDGEITQSPNLKGWEGARPGAVLGCAIVNDANAALLGEAWGGALRGKRSALMVTLGTGVGGGVLLEGRLWTGMNGCAGEIGHVPVGDRELEALASATAVAEAAGTPDAETAAAHARAGGSTAPFEAAGRALGNALAGLVNVLNPEAICIGGGMAGAFDLLLPSMRAELERYAFRLALEGLAIVPATLGGDAGLLGAGYLGMNP